MKNNVWFVKYEKVAIEAKNEDEATDLAYEVLERRCIRYGEDIDDYDISDIEEVEE